MSHKKLVKIIAYHQNSEGKKEKNDSPNKRFVGPFDFIIEKILKEELNSRKNPKELEELCSLIF